MRRLSPMVFLVLAACGVDQTEFIAKYVELECEYAMRCYEPAVLEFRQWATAQDCIDARGPQLTGDSQDCAYDKKAAKACLKAMKEPACPADGEDPSFPDVCNQVFTCEGDDTGGGGEDTDAGTDTDAGA